MAVVAFSHGAGGNNPCAVHGKTLHGTMKPPQYFERPRHGLRIKTSCADDCFSQPAHPPARCKETSRPVRSSATLRRTEFDPISTAAKTGIVHLYYVYCSRAKLSGWAFSFNAPGVLIAAALMQYQLRRTALLIGYKSDLRIYDLQKVVAVALRKNLDFWLCCGLLEQLIAIPGNSYDKVGRKLVAAHVTIEQFGVNLDLFVGMSQGKIWVEQVPPNR